MMRIDIRTLAALCLGLIAAPSAQAADFLYMTGASNPWGQNGGDQAMDAAFGVGNWDKANGFDGSAFASGYKFIYFDGGDGTSTEFNSFVSNNVTQIENFVSSGGRVMLNAARWDYSPSTLGTGFGTSLEGEDTYTSFASNSGQLTAAGVAAGLGLNGAGTSWTGGYFSHDIVTGADTCLVEGTAGCVFGSTAQGLFVGGQTDPFFQSAGGLALRTNELFLAAEGAVPPITPAPEPATWAMLILGFGFVGTALRGAKRRRVGTALAAA